MQAGLLYRISASSRLVSQAAVKLAPHCLIESFESIREDLIAAKGFQRRTGLSVYYQWMLAQATRFHQFVTLCLYFYTSNDKFGLYISESLCMSPCSSDYCISAHNRVLSFSLSRCFRLRLVVYWRVSSQLEKILNVHVCLDVEEIYRSQSKRRPLTSRTTEHAISIARAL